MKIYKVDGGNFLIEFPPDEVYLLSMFLQMVLPRDAHSAEMLEKAQDEIAEARQLN